MMLARYTIVDEVENKTAELNQALELLVQSYDDTLQVLGSALELKDAETAAHCQRVTAYTISIAKSVAFLCRISPCWLAPHFFMTSARCYSR